MAFIGSFLLFWLSRYKETLNEYAMKTIFKLEKEPDTKGKELLYINNPWLIDDSLSVREQSIKADDDEIRIFVPLDLSQNSILDRLHNIIYKYGEANEKNEMSFSADVDLLIVQIEIYDSYWSHKNSVPKGKHSNEAIALVEEFVKILEEIPDGCAEIFPFETIDELKDEYLQDY